MAKTASKTPIFDALREANNNLAAVSKQLGIPRTTLYSRMAIEAASLIGRKVEKLDVVEEHSLRRQLKAEKSNVAEMERRLVQLTAQTKVTKELMSAALNPPDWLTFVPKKKSTRHRATITAFLSDTHFDEIVDAGQMNGVNAYNREIAVERLRCFFKRTIKVTRDYIAGVEIDGLVLALGGDMVSGNIHEELERTNAAPMLNTCVFWAEQLAAGIDMLLEFFPKIFIPAVVGNHGRLRKKPQYKDRAEDNFDWLIYKMLEQYFRRDTRVSFQVPTGREVYYTVYNTRFLGMHGDEFSGGNGIGGIAVPIMRGDAKKQKMSAAIARPYDHMHIGHWHQRLFLGSVFINGTPKGYDEYALAHGFSFEPPQQWLWVNTPERGVTMTCPVFLLSDEEKKFW